MVTLLGDKIKELRIKKKLSQRELAIECGLKTPQYISNIERGLCPCSAELINNVTTVLKVKKSVLVDLAVMDYKTRLIERLNA